MPGNNPRLGSAQELISGETHQINTCLKGFLHRRLVSHAKLGRIKQAARAKVVDHRHSGKVSHLANFDQRGFGCKTNDLEIGAVGAHDEGSRLLQGGFIIIEVHPVCGTNFDQARAGLLHDIRYAESPPISTSWLRAMITARRRARAVRTSKTAAALLLTTRAASAPVRRWSKDFSMHQAAASPPICQVIFKVGVPLRSLAGGLQGSHAERGAPKVGVDDHTRGIDDRAQGGRGPLPEQTTRPLKEGF